jgi:hypothetical protein
VGWLVVAHLQVKSVVKLPFERFGEVGEVRVDDRQGVEQGGVCRWAGGLLSGGDGGEFGFGGFALGGEAGERGAQLCSPLLVGLGVAEGLAGL